MNKVILWLVAIFLVGAVAIAEAQQPKKDPADRIFDAEFHPLHADPSHSRHSGKVCASLATSREKHMSSSIDTRRESPSALPALAAELVRLKVDIIVCGQS